MKKYWKMLLSGALTLAICLSAVVVMVVNNSCGSSYMLNGHNISKYTIVYAADEPDYTERAATYLYDQIAAKTGARLEVRSDKDMPNESAHEIVVGETNRDISASLDLEREGFEFSMMANEDHIAMEGDYFVIAAAAYYFVENYISEQASEASVPSEACVYEPITKEAKNFIFLIGDGMGFEHTKLFETFSADELGVPNDGESAFYGYMFPNIGAARTDSLSGTTDSAASGTALASGFKTYNGYVGKDSELNDVKLLTEIAIELGKAAAVMTTDSIDGATPAAFTAHADNRGNSSSITDCQRRLERELGVILHGSYGSNFKKESKVKQIEGDIQNTLSKLSEDRDGFFLMYEEAYFDKRSHDNDMEETFFAGVRFNQAIGRFMEFAFYNPETFVIITADHETGGIVRGEDGSFSYTTEEHTSVDVPVFAYGQGSEVFGGVTVENIQIPKTIAKMWGVDIVGYDNENFPALNK